MTENSYWENVRRGLTGRRTSTCELASYDRISLRYGVSPQLYADFAEVGARYSANVGDQALYVPQDFATLNLQLRQRLYQELGVATPRNIAYGRANTLEELAISLDRLTSGGFRPAIKILVGGGYPHTVGVIRSESGVYCARSTWTPFEDDNNVTSEEIFAYLERVRVHPRPHSSRGSYAVANIVALPPESAK